MAKLITLFLILIAIQACIILYYSSSVQGGTTTNISCTTNSDCNSTGYYCNPITEKCTKNEINYWNFIMNIDKWNSLDLIIVIVSIAIGLGVIGLASGGNFRFVTDFVVLAPAVAGLISMGVIFTNFAGIIRNELVSRFFPACLQSSTGVLGCTPATFIVAILIGPLAFYYAWSIFEWWRTPVS